MILDTIVNEIYVPVRNLNLHACVKEMRYQKDWDEGGIICGVTCPAASVRSPCVLRPDTLE